MDKSGNSLNLKTFWRTASRGLDPRENQMSLPIVASNSRTVIVGRWIELTCACRLRIRVGVGYTTPFRSLQSQPINLTESVSRASKLRDFFGCRGRPKEENVSTIARCRRITS